MKFQIMEIKFNNNKHQETLKKYFKNKIQLKLLKLY